MEYIAVAGSQQVVGDFLTVGTQKRDNSSVKYLRINLPKAMDAGFEKIDDLINRSRLALEHDNPYPFVEVVQI